MSVGGGEEAKAEKQASSDRALNRNYYISTKSEDDLGDRWSGQIEGWERKETGWLDRDLRNLESAGDRSSSGGGGGCPKVDPTKKNGTTSDYPGN